MDNTATQTSSNADDRAVERGAAEGTQRYWLQKRKHDASPERQPRGKHARKSDTDGSVDERESKRSDPMLLPDVVSNIFQFLDNDTLLTGRLVCQRWNAEITKRNGLWRSRCEGFGAPEPDKTFPPDTDFFRVFLNLRRISHQMSSRQSWQLDNFCDGSRCAFHRELTSGYERVRLASCHEDERFDPWFLTCTGHDIQQLETFGKKSVICTVHGELVVFNEEKRLAWRTDDEQTKKIGKIQDFIFIVTISGDIEVLDLDGEFVATETSGRLEGVRELHVHPTDRFLLVLLEDGRVFLVMDPCRQLGVFPLGLPAPQMSRQLTSQESTDEEYIHDVFLDIHVDGSDEHLAAIIQRKSSVSLVVFTVSGKILHHEFFKSKIASLRIVREQDRIRFVCVSEGHVVARSIRFGSSGIAVDELWREALPARFAGWPKGMTLAGREFFVRYTHETVRAYRTKDGERVAFLPVLLRQRMWYRCADKANPCCRSRSYEYVERRDKVYFPHPDWLDGLSPSTMAPDRPVAVIFSAKHTRGKCLRWSQGLWGNISLPPTQNTEQASDDTAH